MCLMFLVIDFLKINLLNIISRMSFFILLPTF